MRDDDEFNSEIYQLGKSVSRSSVSLEQKRPGQRFSFKPTTDLPLYQLDISQVLQDVFAEYLEPDALLSSMGSGEEEEGEENVPKKIQKKLKSPVEDNEVTKIFVKHSTSQIRDALALHFKHLKSTHETTETQVSSAKETCEHLPKGFSKDQVSSLADLICVGEEASSDVVDEDLLLLIEPPEILFDSYSVGPTFKKKCCLRNCSGKFLKGRITQPSCSQMSLNQYGNVSLSTGLGIHLIISFSPINLKPTTSSFSIFIERGKEQHREIKVPVSAFRPPPLLEGFELYATPDDQEIMKYLNFGEVLISSHKVMNLKLTNVGSLSTFILTAVTLTDFDEAQVEDKFEINEMPFSLNPRKFILEKDESIDIEVGFHPDIKKKFSQNVNILCTDNVYTDQFNLVGESISIERKNIVFKALEKNFQVDIEDDMLAEHYIDFQKVFPSQTVTSSFSLGNTCIMPLKYHWEYRSAVANSDYVDIPPGNLKITPKTGTFKNLSKEKFIISCRMANSLPNVYKCVLRFLIDELTVDSVDEEDVVYIIKPNNPSSSLPEMVSLNCGEIEIWVEVVSPIIFVTPCVLKMTLSNSNKSNNANLEVQNVSHEPVTLEWQMNDLNLHPNLSIKIYPAEVRILPKTTIDFLVQTSFDRPACFEITSFEESLTCVLNGGESYLDLVIMIDLLNDQIVLGKRKIEFNSYNEGMFLDKDLIHLEPSNLEDLMKIYETKLKEIVPELKCNQDIDEYTDSMVTHISKNVVTREGLVFDILEWEDDASWIIGDVRGYNVILFPAKLELYMFHEFHNTASVVIHNRSLVPTKFRWGESYGVDNDMLKIWFKNSGDYLLPNCKVTVDMFVFPLQYGMVRDFMVPCYLKYMTDPLILQVRGMVEPLRILLEWEIEQGLYQTSWDPIAKDSNICSFHHDSIDENLKGLLCDFKPINEGSSVAKVIGGIRERVISELHGNRCNADTNLPNISTKTMMGNMDPLASNGMDIPRDSLMMFFDSCGPLGCQIGNIVSKVLYDKALRFNSRIGENQSQVISIKNMTPIKTSFSIKAEIFYWDEEAPEYPDYLCEDTCFEFSNTCKPCSLEDTGKRIVGLYLDIDPSISELDAYQEIEVTVTAYPDVWGEYVDVLVVRVTGLPSYSIPVFVNAVGPPISFTFDPRSRPHLRFGTLKPGEEVSHDVTLKNNSYVPLKIAWSAYCKHRNTKLKHSKFDKPPFSLAVDLHNPIIEHFCSLELFDYFGFQEDNPFEVSPGVTYIEPFGEIRMKMSVKVPNTSKVGLLEGTYFGLIYENPHQRHRWRSLCHRSTGFLQPFELKMSTYVEIPSVKLVSGGKIKRNLCFKVDAKQVVEKKKVIVCKRYTLKNMSHAETVVSLKVEPPFSITDMLHEDGTKRKSKDTKRIELQPQHSMTMNICLEVTRDSLEDDEELFQDEIVEMVISQKQSDLYIHQSAVKITERVKLYYEVHYPFFQFSCKRLVFGPVFVNEVKVIVLRITAISGQEVFRIEHSDVYKDDYYPFTFTPTSGILEKGRYIEVPISFSPKESRGYLEEIKIKTAVPICTFYVVLEGVGTWNYKFHQITKHPK